METLCSHVNCQFEVFLPRSRAPAWERRSWKLCFPIVRTASDAVQPTVKVIVSCMIARQFAKRSFEKLRSQAGAFEVALFVFGGRNWYCQNASPFR